MIDDLYSFFNFYNSTFLILGNITVLPAFIHFNSYFSNFPTLASFPPKYLTANDMEFYPWEYWVLAAYLKVTRTFSEVHHFILKFVFLYSTNMISTCSIKIISPKSSTKSMIQEINQTYPVTSWLSYTFPSLKSLRRIPKVPYHQAMFSEDQFNTCLRADCSWEFVYFNEQGICVRVFEFKFWVQHWGRVKWLSISVLQFPHLFLIS